MLTTSRPWSSPGYPATWLYRW